MRLFAGLGLLVPLAGLWSLVTPCEKLGEPGEIDLWASYVRSLEFVGRFRPLGPVIAA